MDDSYLYVSKEERAGVSDNGEDDKEHKPAFRPGQTKNQDREFIQKKYGAVWAILQRPVYREFWYLSDTNNVVARPLQVSYFPAHSDRYLDSETDLCCISTASRSSASRILFVQGQLINTRSRPSLAINWSLGNNDKCLCGPKTYTAQVWQAHKFTTTGSWNILVGFGRRQPRTEYSEGNIQ